MGKKIIWFVWLMFTGASAVFSQQSKYRKGIKAFKNMDCEKAVYLLKSFADDGEAEAQYILGYCYFSHRVTVNRDALAEKYLLKAAHQAHSDAIRVLGIYYAEKFREDDSYKIKAMVWGVLAAAHDPILKGLAEQLLAPDFATLEELKTVRSIVLEKQTRIEVTGIELVDEAIAKRKDKLKRK